MDTLRIVSSKDVGKDEAGVQSLLKKHKVNCLSTLILLWDRIARHSVFWFLAIQFLWKPESVFEVPTQQVSFSENKNQRLNQYLKVLPKTHKKT